MPKNSARHPKQLSQYELRAMQSSIRKIIIVFGQISPFFQILLLALNTRNNVGNDP
jgi:hypothetical protein